VGTSRIFTQQTNGSAFNLETHRGGKVYITSPDHGAPLNSFKVEAMQGLAPSVCPTSNVRAAGVYEKGEGVNFARDLC